MSYLTTTSEHLLLGLLQKWLPIQRFNVHLVRSCLLLCMMARFFVFPIPSCHGLSIVLLVKGIAISPTGVTHADAHLPADILIISHLAAYASMNTSCTNSLNAWTLLSQLLTKHTHLIIKTATGLLNLNN